MFVHRKGDSCKSATKDKSTMSRFIFLLKNKLIKVPANAMIVVVGGARDEKSRFKRVQDRMP